MESKIIHLDLEEIEALLTRDALTDTAIALRTKPNEVVIDERTFLADPSYSIHRKERYHISMDIIEKIETAMCCL